MSQLGTSTGHPRIGSQRDAGAALAPRPGSIFHSNADLEAFAVPSSPASYAFTTKTLGASRRVYSSNIGWTSSNDYHRFPAIGTHHLVSLCTCDVFICTLCSRTSGSFGKHEHGSRTADK